MQPATLAVPVLGNLPGYDTSVIQVTSGGGDTAAIIVQAEALTDQTHDNNSNQSSAPEPDPLTLEADKRKIYEHPLFPLMGLLFEKCEQATQTPDCPSSDSFDIDIQTFVHHQETDRKPFLVDDPELDGVMLKAIQVLRIHLLELEKVTDLCKDFCQRYTSCLKGKLQSENLLRIEGMDDDSPISSPTLQMDSGPSYMVQPSTAMNVTTLNPGQIISGGTVYQMVQTPQGLVAQPIQIQQVAQAPVTSCTPHIIHGSTPLSQIGSQNSATPTQNQSPSSLITTTSLPSASPTALSPMEDEDSKRKNSKRGILPKSATQVMKSWLFQHIVHPYPTEDEKRQLANQTNLTLLQVNNWFINARRRILQPMLDASNPEPTKAKKNKPQNRPVQRFWPESIANIQPNPQAVQAITRQQSQDQKETEESPGETNYSNPMISGQASTVNLENLSPMLSHVHRTSPKEDDTSNTSNMTLRLESAAEADLGM